MGSVEANHSSRRGEPSKIIHRTKRRQGVRLDMTPMVDVAFLLLTFLIDLLDEIHMAKMGRFSVAPMEDVDREILKNIPS